MNVKYLIGNWKANKTPQEAKSWIDKVRQERVKIHRNLKVVLCPSYIHLGLFRQELPQLTLGCQDLSPYGDGAYTGEVTARMLAGLVDYAILGHSERRRYFSETETQVAQKATLALENGITPIIAVDMDNWRKQINALDDAQQKRSIFMYEPPEAISRQIGPIGEGEAAPIDEVTAMIQKIKQEKGVPVVIYGGSVKSHNISTFMKEDVIDGALPGSASLNAGEWLRMLESASDALQGEGENP